MTASATPPRLPRPAGGRAGVRGAPGIGVPGSRAAPRSPAARGRVIAGLALAAALGACAPAPSAPPPASDEPVGTPAPASPGIEAGPRLLLLGNVAGRRTLSLLRPGAAPVILPVPGPVTVAVVPLADGSLVSLLADGRAHVVPGGAAGLLAGEEWQPLGDGGALALPPGTALGLGAALVPRGSVLAAVARPSDADVPASLVLVDAATGERRVVPLAGGAAGPPPAWIDERRVAILARDALDRTELAVADAADGIVVASIAMRALDVRTSGDGATVAVLASPESVLVGPTAELLESRTAPPGGPALAPGDWVVGGMALDATGRRLAVVGEDAGGSSWIVVHERDGAGWRETARLAPPQGAGGGEVAWLP